MSASLFKWFTFSKTKSMEWIDPFDVSSMSRFAAICLIHENRYFWCTGIGFMKWMPTVLAFQMHKSHLCCPECYSSFFFSLTLIQMDHESWMWSHTLWLNFFLFVQSMNNFFTAKINFNFFAFFLSILFLLMGTQYIYWFFQHSFHS